MFNNIITYLLVTVIVVLGGYGFYKARVVIGLEEENQHQADAIVAYEQILKVVPFEALGEERRVKANEEINTTISNDDTLADITYKL